jgi:uncharacterized coiled-coil protein SlyX
MSAPLAAFRIEELEELDAHQVDLLRNAIERELRESDEIKAIIRRKFEPMLNRMRSRSPSGRR